MTEDIVVVKQLQEIISLMQVKDYYNEGSFLSINYEPGRSKQILDELSAINNSLTIKGLKYPLIAALMPIRELRGGGYVKVTFPRIVIATMTKTNTGSESVLPKYDLKEKGDSDSGTFLTTLYPCYNELMSQFAKSRYIIGSDWSTFVHTKTDNPCQQPLSEGSSDYVDTIEILNLELKFNQIKTC